MKNRSNQASSKILDIDTLFGALDIQVASGAFELACSFTEKTMSEVESLIKAERQYLKIQTGQNTFHVGLESLKELESFEILQ